MALVSPDLFSVGERTISRLKDPSSGLHHFHPNLDLWTSIFSGVQVIVNRDTPSHRDSGAAPPMYDLLVSAGTHTSAALELLDLKAEFSYGPGTMVALSGRVLRHKVMGWEGGERICLAHFVKDAVHDRLGLRRPPWSNQATYFKLINVFKDTDV